MDCGCERGSLVPPVSSVHTLCCCINWRLRCCSNSGDSSRPFSQRPHAQETASLSRLALAVATLPPQHAARCSAQFIPEPALLQLWPAADCAAPTCASADCECMSCRSAALAPLAVDSRHCSKLTHTKCSLSGVSTLKSSAFGLSRSRRELAVIEKTEAAPRLYATGNKQWHQQK